MFASIAPYRAMLGTYLRPQRGRVAALAATLLGGIGLQLLGPQLLRAFIDAAQQQRPLETLTRLALLFLALAVVRYLLGLAATYLSERVGWAATNALRVDLVRHCLRLDLAFHRQHGPGELIERVDGDVGQLSSFFSQLVIQALGSLLLMAGVLLALLLEDWRVGLAFTSFTLVTLAILYTLRDIATAEIRDEREQGARLVGFLEERLAGTEEIRASGAVAHTLARLDQAVGRYGGASLRAQARVATLRTTIIFFFSASGILALALGAWLFWAGSVSLGTVYLIYAYVGMLASPVERLALEAQNLQQAGASLLRIADLAGTQPTILDGSGARLGGGPPAVTFERVGFAYEGADGPAGTSGEPGGESGRPGPARPAALTDVSFTLAPGEHLGVVGRTGSGKTTLARLLTRLYDPTTGAIRLDDADLRDLPLADVRRTVGVVTQDVQLIGTTLRDNLALFDPATPDAQMLAALEEVGLGTWASNLPLGLDTPLEAWGLSAGEAQLLAMARALLREPGLVILDEASSRLDPATERRIEQAVERVLRPSGGPRTAVIIAHRLATLERVDRILVLENGRVVECGPRHALADDPSSRFAALLREASLAKVALRP